MLAVYHISRKASSALAAAAAAADTTATAALVAAAGTSEGLWYWSMYIRRCRSEDYSSQ